MSRRWCCSLLALLLGGVFGCAWLRVSETGPVLSEPALRFHEVPVDFAHRWDPERSHHLSGAAVLDLDGDGREEIFVGGGVDQEDRFLGFRDGRLQPVPGDWGVSANAATYGSLAIDVEPDGDVDLFVCRQDGLTLYRRDGDRFVAEAIPLELEPDAIPLAVSGGDLDGDGDLDLYLSVFITGPLLRSATYNDPEHAKGNRLLRNDGDAGWVDITDPVTRSLQNSFTTGVVDLDGDGLPELVIAQNTGEVELLANRGGGRFERVPLDTGFGFWMGLALGDIDADGDTDLFFSNLGNSIPSLFTRGDLRDDQRYDGEWLLLRNEGGLRFSDATAASDLHGYGFAWGALFEDLDLDGRLDLLVAENYVKWPLHGLRKLPSKALLQRDGRFVHARGLDSHAYGQSPVVLDFDGDGRHDVFWLNNDGPSQAFRSVHVAPSLRVVLPDDVRSLGAKLELRGTGRPTHRLAGGVGLGIDPTPGVSFALPATGETELEVLWPGGERTRRTVPASGGVLQVAPAAAR